MAAELPFGILVPGSASRDRCPAAAAELVGEGFDDVAVGAGQALQVGEGGAGVAAVGPAGVAAADPDVGGSDQVVGGQDRGLVSEKVLGGAVQLSLLREYRLNADVQATVGAVAASRRTPITCWS
jgi:hypothetical protein